MRTHRRAVLAGLALQPLLARGAHAEAEEAASKAALGTREAARKTWGVRTVDPVWVPVGEGLRLAGRMWIPKGAPGERFPVVFEYIPYRTHDSYRPLDDHWGPQLAAGGVAFARIDIRGSGDSDGLLRDEYLESEQEDGVRIIAWLARQPWCTGSVGMRGLSWGGFSTLQVAAKAPSALKAIMPMCATDMRFWNDAHYVGGAPGLTNLKWAAGFEMVMSGPPDPAVVGTRWREMWRRRVEATPSIAARWLAHQSNDAYWRHGSVGMDYGAIRCPVYLVDGWADSYAESAERLLRGLKVPTKALFGPWGHIYPDLAFPGPGLDWIFEELRWWRHWLAGEETGVMEGPKLRFYMPYAKPADTRMKALPGRWAAEASWPSPNVRSHTLYLSPGRLQETPPPPQTLSYVADRVVGLTKPEWIPYAVAELPRDQRPDDARSLVFDMAPLSAPLEILGIAVVRVRVASDRPAARLAARLCEVHPDGTSTLVTSGILDLGFRAGPMAPPEALTPGAAYDIELPLSVMAHRFSAGSTLRLSLSESLWPLVWPSPEVVTLTLSLGDARLVLPVRPQPDHEAPFPIPLTQPDFSRGDPVLRIEETKDEVRVHGAWPDAASRVAGVGTILSGSGPNMELSLGEGAPNSGRWVVTQSSRFVRGAWSCEMRVRIEMTSDPTHYVVQERFTALENGVAVVDRRRRDTIPRGAAVLAEAGRAEGDGGAGGPGAPARPETGS